MHGVRLQLSRRTAAALALTLLGVLFFVPSAEAHHRAEQRFLVVSTDPRDDATPPVLGFGRIHAKGVDHVISDTKDAFVFPKGTLFVRHTRKAGNESSDPATCLFRFWESGTYVITRGTGAYQGAHGHGRYFVKGLAIGCNPNALPSTFTFQVRAAGSLDF